MTSSRRPLEHAVELLVYAPIGLLYEAPNLLPRLVDRGRREATARMRALGLGAAPEPAPRTSPAEPAPSQAPEPATTEPAPAPVPSGPGAETLAIPDYESLSASQVVPRLQVLSPDELEAIRVFELGNRHRSTILNKIAQLQAG